jgi:pyruvate dehydrogenase E2 component (dihydrolipoyllysine-residue acetyltransferase)
VPTEIRLPELADSATSVRLVSWVKREGERVATGDVVAEVETDKTTVEIEAPCEGVLGLILVPAGAGEVAIGTVIGTIVEGDPGAGGAVAQTGERPSQRAAVVNRPAGSTLHAEPPVREPDTRAGQPADGPTRTVLATPLAAKMAKLAAIDLTEVAPSGQGRVTKADVERTLQQRQLQMPVVAPPRPAMPESVAERPPLSGSGGFDDRPLSAMRRVTAARLLQAKQTIPHFYLEADCRVDDLMAVRRQINARNDGLKITITDFVVVAAARALRRVPVANSAWADTVVRVFENVDIAVAVSTPRGLVTPIVRNAHLKGLVAISRELKELSDRARRGQLQPGEYTGGTFTISNLGMFGVTGMTPIINPPQSCILGVGSIEARPVVADGQLRAGHMMRCTLAADHRAIDGVEGAELLSEIRRLLESPVAMAFEV